MGLKRTRKDQTYNDGTLIVQDATISQSNGGRPIRNLTPLATLRYEERTVGLNRFWSGKQNKVRIDALLRVPRINCSTQNLISLSDGSLYEIKQIQYPKDVTPPSMDLSLERMAETL